MCRSFFAVLAVVTVVANGQRETCLSTEQDPYLLFGTKTAYIFANKGILCEDSDRPHDVARLGCQPAAIWLLSRHGSHNPETDEIIELQKLVDLKNNIVTHYKSGNCTNLNERICESDMNLLEKWEWSPLHNLSFTGDLTSDAYITTQQQAEAWRQRFPGLLTNYCYDYLFKFVNDERSGNTYRVFTEVLFGAQAESLNIPIENDEKLLRPYKFCRAWTRDVDEDSNTLSQVYIFESKREYKKIITNISHRLGFDYNIHKDVILLIYQMCRYNKAWDVNQTSPWCAAFTKEDLKRLEYSEDLKTFYKYGHGSPVNKKIGCTFVKDMMNFFAEHVYRIEEGLVFSSWLNPLPPPRSMIHFTEAPMLLMTLAAMGVHQDSAPLTGDNYRPNVVQSRRWSSSSMAPFNANLAAVLYKCTVNGNFQINEQHQVLFLENEKPITLEGCREGLCDWSYVKNRFNKISNRCDLEFCNSKISSASNVNGFIGTSIALVVFLGKFVPL